MLGVGIIRGYWIGIEYQRCDIVTVKYLNLSRIEYFMFDSMIFLHSVNLNSFHSFRNIQLREYLVYLLIILIDYWLVSNNIGKLFKCIVTSVSFPILKNVRNFRIFIYFRINYLMRFIEIVREIQWMKIIKSQQINGHKAK